MGVTDRLCQEAAAIFKAAVRSVKPEGLVERIISISPPSLLHVCDKTYSLSENVYVVGFGKAVYGMAVAIERVIGNHLVSGIISVPRGLQKQITADGFSCLKQNSKIQVFEGAENNLPDTDSMTAAIHINNLTSSLKKTDILFVLISGGGSALLPIPVPGITVQDKLNVAKLLTTKGVPVQEINTVRKQLSLVKGGRLALTAKPAQVVSLILSDIIGDPLDLIASGPTVKNTDNPDKAFNILQKYNLLNDVPIQVIEVLKKSSEETIPSTTDNRYEHVENILLACNKDALGAAFNEAKILNYVPVILTAELQGPADAAGQRLAALAKALGNGEYALLDELLLKLNVPLERKKCIVSAATESVKNQKYLCLLFGGETTVEVKGNGIGGRNQELALSASIHLKTLGANDDVVILSAGTDGIDGPTSAAGAIGSCGVFNLAVSNGLEPVKFLENNDSFNFFNRLNNSLWHVITGHTGTNVMDIVILLKCKS